MKRSFLMHSVATLIVLSVSCCVSVPAAAQNGKLPPGAVQDKQVQTGYGLDKDQPFAGADPDGTGLPFKEPRPRPSRRRKRRPRRTCLTDIRTLLGSGRRPVGVTPSLKEDSVRMGRLITRSARRRLQIRRDKRPKN